MMLTPDLGHGSEFWISRTESPPQPTPPSSPLSPAANPSTSQHRTYHMRKFPKKSRTKVDKVNAELVTLTYGTIVAQLCNDYDSDYVEVNKQLDKMGYNIGMRLIEDFLAKSNTGRCANFRETADMISKVRSEIYIQLFIFSFPDNAFF